MAWCRRSAGFFGEAQPLVGALDALASIAESRVLRRRGAALDRELHRRMLVPAREGDREHGILRRRPVVDLELNPLVDGPDDSAEEVLGLGLEILMAHGVGPSR
jgi:hypothetical protein